MRRQRASTSSPEPLVLSDAAQRAGGSDALRSRARLCQRVGIARSVPLDPVRSAAGQRAALAAAAAATAAAARRFESAAAATARRFENAAATAAAACRRLENVAAAAVAAACAYELAVRNHCSKSQFEVTGIRFT